MADDVFVALYIFMLAAIAGHVIISRAVSYTHLDVYKRQALGRLCFISARRRQRRFRRPLRCIFLDPFAALLG